MTPNHTTTEVKKGDIVLWQHDKWMMPRYGQPYLPHLSFDSRKWVPSNYAAHIPICYWRIKSLKQ